MSQRTLEVANIILSQIKGGNAERYNGGSAFWAMGAWGFQKPVATDTDKGPALIFTVRGSLHSGKVRVVLNWMDEYTISLWKPGEDDWTEVLDGVQAPELTDTLDRLIEK